MPVFSNCSCLTFDVQRSDSIILLFEKNFIMQIGLLNGSEESVREEGRTIEEERCE